jgi:hypothetical protein
MRDFCALPDVIYRDYPQRIARLRIVETIQFDKRRNPFHRDAFIEHFIARDASGVCVGRIAAIAHPAYIQLHGQKAFFGFFESTNDPVVAMGLFAAVEGWAAERALPDIIGPFSYTTSQDVGLLLDSFDTSPSFLQPYNPSYYKTLFEHCGYQCCDKLYTYRASRHEHSYLIPRLRQRAEAVLVKERLSVRPVDMSRYDEELAMLRRIYNRAFKGYPAAVPITPAVFAFQAEDLKSIIDARIARIVLQDDEPIGFAIMVPNLNEILASSNGRLSLRLILRWKFLLRKIRSVVVLMVGADPTSFGSGIGRCLSYEIARTIESGQYDEVFTTWIHQDNWASKALVHSLGIQSERTYGIFQNRYGNK